MIFGFNLNVKLAKKTEPQKNDIDSNDYRILVEVDGLVCVLTLGLNW